MRRQRKIRAHHRRLFLQQLEARECLAFDFGGFAGGILSFTGTNAADTLNSIYIGANGNVWFRTPAGAKDTGVPAPTAAAPIQISIDGLGGNDLVDLVAGSAAISENNLGSAVAAGPTFPNNSVTKIGFAGGDGNDEFFPPEGRVLTTGPGPVILPAPGAGPNIKFYGGNHVDTLHNGDHPELFHGDPGNDIVIITSGGGGGNDLLNGGTGIDTLDGGGGNDQINGDGDNDNLIGGGGDDTLNGGAGDDIIQGNGGWDVINGDADSDTISGGAGADLIYTGTSGLPIGTLFFIDSADGGPDDDVIYGDAATYNTLLTGGDGNDWIVGSEFDDTISGGAGNDYLYGRGGADTITGGLNDDNLYGESGVDDLDDTQGINALYGGSSDDRLKFFLGDTFDGGADNDDLTEMGGRGVIFDLDVEKDWHPKVGSLSVEDMAGNAITSIIRTEGAKIVFVANGVADMGGAEGDIDVLLWRDKTPAPNGVLKLDEDVDYGKLTSQGGGTYKKDYTIADLEAGTYKFFAYARDSEGFWGAYDTVEITIKAAPKSEDDAYFRTFGMGGIVSIGAAEGVLANDTDEDGGPLTAEIYSSPQNGTVSVNSDGSFVYTRSSDDVIYDSFQYVAFDGENYSEPATVTLNLTNPSPVSGADSFTVTAVNGTVDAPGVLGNDSDPDGQPLTAYVVTEPAHGTVSMNSDGSFVYTPEPGYVGEDSFTYQASDGYSSGNTVTITITVANSATEAFDDYYVMYAISGILTISSPGVLANDTDADGHALTASLLTYPEHGLLALNADGSFTYTLSEAFVGTVEFTYEISDGYSTSWATVTIEVLGGTPPA